MIDGLRYVESDRHIDISTETMVDEVLPEYLVRSLYAVWDGPRVDFGGGVFGITCSDLLEHCDGSWRKLRKITGLKVKESKQVIEICEKAMAEEPYQ